MPSFERRVRCRKFGRDARLYWNEQRDELRGTGDHTVRLSAQQRRALELLASSRRGVNEELLVLAHGFSRRMLARLLRRGLVAVERQVMKAVGKTIEVSPVRITAAGQRAIKS